MVMDLTMLKIRSLIVMLRFDFSLFILRSPVSGISELVNKISQIIELCHVQQPINFSDFFVSYVFRELIMLCVILRYSSIVF